MNILNTEFPYSVSVTDENISYWIDFRLAEFDNYMIPRVDIGIMKWDENYSYIWFKYEEDRAYFILRFMS